MRKFLTLGSVIALTMAMFVGSAGAHHRDPKLEFSPSDTVSVDDAVTLTGTAFQGDDQKTVELERCMVDDVHSPRVACEEGDGTWDYVEESTGREPTLTYEPDTSTAGVFGYRIISGDHDYDSGDLTVLAVTTSDRHEGCNGIEVALTKANDNGRRALERIAQQFGCAA
jgi:hypothetical protein